MTQLSQNDLLQCGVTWFKELLRFDTSNPPGHERVCIEWIAATLKSYGIESEQIGLSPDRPNLLAQVGDYPSFFLSSHVDVVPPGSRALWQQEPFGGIEADGCIWGRGAVDVKYKAAFDMVALIHAKQEKRALQAVFVVDEECTTGFGSAYLVRNHRDKLRGSHVLNEVGGFPLRILGSTFFPIQAGEKGARTVHVKLKGPGGHASLPVGGNPIDASAAFIAEARALFGNAEITEVTKGFISGLKSALPSPFSDLVGQLANPSTALATAEQIPDPVFKAQLISMLFPTFVPTEISAGVGANVVPSELSLTADLRFFPSQKSTLGDLQWIKRALGKSIAKLNMKGEVSLDGDTDGYLISPEDKVLKAVGGVLEKRWQGRAVPFLLPASSDSSMYASVGITPVGFAPLKFGPSFEGFALAHAPNERVERAAFEEGLLAYIEAIDLLSSGRY